MHVALLKVKYTRLDKSTNVTPEAKKKAEEAPLLWKN